MPRAERTDSGSTVLAAAPIRVPRVHPTIGKGQAHTYIFADLPFLTRGYGKYFIGIAERY